MKKYVSVLQMFTRSSFYKVVVILIGMVVIQFANFYRAMQTYNDEVLEKVMDYSYFSWGWKIAYLLITIVLVLPSCNIGSVQDYTLRRLRIKEKSVYLLQSIYNTLCYVLLWMTQLVVLLMTTVYYLKHTTIEVTNQSVFLAFYRNDFMHSILPLEDIFGWILLVYFFVGTGFAAEQFCRRQRIGKLGWELILMVGFMVLIFPRALGGSLIIYLIAWIVIPLQFVYRKMLDWEVADNERK